MKLSSILIFILLFSAFGCSSDDELILGPTDMWYKAKDFDPSTELVFLSDTPEGRARRVLCENYRSEGCVDGSGKRIKVRLVELLVIQYETSQQACLAALEIGQWYAFNWLFDDVSGEPVLEDYVLKAFAGKKPEKKEDCDF